MKSFVTFFIILEILILSKFAYDLYLLRKMEVFKMNLKQWNKLSTTNKRTFLILSKQLYNLSCQTNSKYKAVIING